MIISYDQTKDKVLKRYDDFLEIVRQSGFPREDCLFTALEKQGLLGKPVDTRKK